MKHRLQFPAADPKQTKGHAHIEDGAGEHLGIPDSPFLNVSEAARFCRFDDCADPETAFRAWARRQAVPALRRGGRKLLFDPLVLRRYLRSA